MATKKPRRRRLFHRRKSRPGTSPGQIQVDPEAQASHIQIATYGPDELVEEQVASAADLEPLLGRHPVTWVNVDGLGDAHVLEQIGERFGIHPLALEDVVNVHQRSKVEAYGGTLFVVARLFHKTEPLGSEQVSLFFGEGFVVTFQERRGDCWDAVRERMRREGTRLRVKGADYLAYALVDAVVDHYFPILEQYSDHLERLEEAIFTGLDVDLVSRIHNVKRDLLDVRRAIWPLREAINQLWREEGVGIKEETRVFLRDCYDHTVQLIEVLESFREIGSGMIDLYLSLLGQRTNDVMKVLTIIATIFIPLGFVAGLYGMNFDPEVSPLNMPELGWYWGYPFVLTIMASTAIGLLFFFRRKGWL